jgi:hypothetical protein
VTQATDLHRYYGLTPDDLTPSATPGWFFGALCPGKRGGCQHFEHDGFFGRGRLRHLIRYVPREAA